MKVSNSVLNSFAASSLLLFAPLSALAQRRPTGGGGGGRPTGGGGGGPTPSPPTLGGGGGSGTRPRNTPATDFCGTVPSVTYVGQTTLIDVDGSGAFPPTIGDMSISENISPISTVGDSTITIKAVCVLTNADPSAGPPMCTFDSSIRVPAGPPGSGEYLEGTTLAMGSPPMLKLAGGSGDFFGAYGTIETGEDLVISPNDDGTSDLTFTAEVNFCVPAPVPEPPSCVNDPDWTFTLRDGREEDCDWVALDPRRRCRSNGSTGSAREQCSAACDSECGAPIFE